MTSLFICDPCRYKSVLSLSCSNTHFVSFYLYVHWLRKPGSSFVFRAQLTDLIYVCGVTWPSAAETPCLCSSSQSHDVIWLLGKPRIKGRDCYSNMWINLTHSVRLSVHVIKVLKGLLLSHFLLLIPKTTPVDQYLASCF